MCGTHSLKPIDEGEEEMTAVITEAQRFEMQTCLRGLMGEEVANTMMEHLPPSGWSDVARQSDIALVRGDLDQAQAALKSDIALVRGEIELVKVEIAHVGKELSGLKTILLVVGPLIAGGFGGIYALIATKF
jgi:hypothetical protein